MRTCRLTILVLGLFLAATAQAREWERVAIPGAVCGDGSPYAVFVSRKDPRKVAFELMGGGACWSLATCIGPTPHAWTHAIPRVIEKSGFVSDVPADSPVSDFTLVHFPYCTGDVHLGTHVATYAPGVKIHHVGRLNFERALRHLTANRLVDLPGAERFVLYGYSAGSLGALVHVDAIDAHLKPGIDKVLVADSPGLHFGSDFWERFTPEQVRDYAEALAVYGASPKNGDGNLAFLAPEACRRHPGWRFAFLQGSRDIVMARIFGRRSLAAHEADVFGPRGLYVLTSDPADNCAAWVSRSRNHIFLWSGLTAKIKATNGMTAMQFTARVVGGREAGDNAR